MKTRNKILLGIGIVTVVAAMAVGGYLFYEYQQFSKHLFLDHSTLNGLDVSCMSVDNAYNVIYEDSKNKKLMLTADNSNLLELNISDFCEISFDREAIQQGINEITFSDFLQGKSRDYKAECSVVFDRSRAVVYVKEMLSQIEQIKSRDARIKKTNDGFKLVEETYGTVIKRKKLLDEIASHIEEIAKNEMISIDVTEFYKQPSVKKEDLEEDYQKLQDYLNWKITYKNSNIKITGKDLFNYIQYKNKKREIIVDNSFLRNKVTELANALNTAGKTRRFKVTSYGNSKKGAHFGKEISVSGGTYGRLVNTEAEYNELSSLLGQCKSAKKREPVWLLRAQSDGEDDIGNTYIEISIDRQHLWYYVKGKLTMETDIVTGMKGKHDTPTGTYYITERINGKYLTGDDYKTWVNKWMRLTNMGIGLHDATWKSSFGGSIYTYNGSHGCINLPYSFACDLFDEVFVGLPVIIYDEG